MKLDPEEKVGVEKLDPEEIAGVEKLDPIVVPDQLLSGESDEPLLQ